MNPLDLYEAYSAVYDEELREEFLTVEEDFEFVDDLSDNELDQIMEEILSEGTTLSECMDAFDALMLSEATVTSSDDRPSGGSAKVTSSSDRRAAKTAERRKQVRVGRVMQAAGRAAEKVKSGAKKVGGKLAAAKERISSAISKVGRAGKAAYKAAKHELSGQADKEAKARTTGREMRRAARRQASAARGRDTSAFEKPKAPQGAYRGQGSGSKEKAGGKTEPSKPTTYDLTSARRKAAHEKLKRSASGTRGGTRFAGPRGQVASKAMHSGQGSSEQRSKKAAQFAKSAGLGEEFVSILEELLQDMIFEGYVDNYDTAIEILESLSESDFVEVMDSYLVEEVEERDDLFDVILEYLVSEGYADTNQDAIVIMANMSEEWREEILEEYKDFPTAKVVNKAGKLMGSSAGKTDPKSKKKEKRGIKMMDVTMQHTPDR